MRCSYAPYVIIAKYVPFHRHFYDIKKKLICYCMLNFGDTNSCYRRKSNVSACRQKRLLRGQIIIAKVTLERDLATVTQN